MGLVVIEVRPATDIDDVRTMVGPKRPHANVCWCLSYRLPSRENRLLRGTERAAKVAELMRQGPPGVLAYDADEVVGWAAVHARADTSFATSRKIAHADDSDLWSVWCIRVRPGRRGKGSPMRWWPVPSGSRVNPVRRPSKATWCDNRGQKLDLTMAYVGTRTLFEKAGFKKVSDRTRSTASRGCS